MKKADIDARPDGAGTKYLVKLDFSCSGCAVALATGQERKYGGRVQGNDGVRVRLVRRALQAHSDRAFEAGDEFVIPSRSIVRVWNDDDESASAALDERLDLAPRVQAALEERGLTKGRWSTDGFQVDARKGLVTIPLADAAKLLDVEAVA